MINPGSSNNGHVSHQTEQNMKIREAVTVEIFIQSPMIADTL